MTDYPTDPRALLAHILDAGLLAEDAPDDLFAHIRRVVDGVPTEEEADALARMMQAPEDDDLDATLNRIGAEFVASMAAMTPAESAEHAIIKAAARGEDLRSRRACWTCKHAKGTADECHIPGGVYPVAWIDANCVNGECVPTARNCPGYEDAP